MLPEALTVAEPLDPPKQETLLELRVVDNVPIVTVVEAAAVQPELSVTVTV